MGRESIIQFVFGRILAARVIEFPHAEVEWLINTVKAGGVSALLGERIKAMECCFVVAAWAFGKLAEQPDDGAFFCTPGEDDLACELRDLLVEAGDLQPEAISGVRAGPIVDQLLNLAVSYLLSLLLDADRIEDFAEKVIDWLKELKEQLK